MGETETGEEFKASLGYIVRPYLKNKKEEKEKIHELIHKAQPTDRILPDLLQLPGAAPSCPLGPSSPFQACAHRAKLQFWLLHDSSLHINLAAPEGPSPPSLKYL
jgi:hypothetical protein